MGVTYSLLDADKKKLGDTRVNVPCFSEFPYGWRDSFSFRDIAYINFKVKLNYLCVKEATAYLALLPAMGFNINQTPVEILKDGYLLSIRDLCRGDHTYASEVGAHLTVVRYISEFSRIVAALLDIMEINPTTDAWLAMQLAHVFPVAGKHSERRRNYFGVGHALFPIMWGHGNPYKSWPEVERDIVKSCIWQPEFSSWKINITYGQPYSYDAVMINKIKQMPINNDVSLQKAITCIKSLYVPKAII